MQIINKGLLNKVSDEARKNDRHRKNYNFHEELDNPVHRLLNALQPETYIRPHRHTIPAKEEALLVLSGTLLFFKFDDDGQILEALKMGPDTENYGVDMKAGEWHTVVSLECNTVIYEVKQGPFYPLADDDAAPWAPDGSNTEEAEAYKNKLIEYFNNSVND